MTVYTEERDIQTWPEWTASVTTLDGIPQDAERAFFRRERNSHRGIEVRTGLKKLIAHQVNQDFLDEIGALSGLVYLEMDGVTAADLTPLTQLRQLKTIKLISVRKAEHFEQLPELPALERLFIENAKMLSDLEFLSGAHRLRSIGVEGSIWTKQTIASLQPLSGLASLESLFMTSVRLKDKDLSCLATCPNLRLFQCARLASRSQFAELRALMPNLVCSWCDDYDG